MFLYQTYLGVVWAQKQTRAYKGEKTLKNSSAVSEAGTLPLCHKNNLYL